MKDRKLSKVMKTALIIVLAALSLFLLYIFARYVLGLDQQWWIKATILTCLASALVIAFLLRKLWLKRRESKFVDGIIGSDAMPGSLSAVDEASRVLRRRFKDAVATLKKSHLKRKGNPLYVLPWYLMVGKSGSGKSTAVKSARLPSPFGDINRVSGIEGTRNCDWWFFDNSVVIDIAGRYSVHRNTELDRGEWLAFLAHLVKYRKKEPINGIIVTVEADNLMAGDSEKIEDEGRTIRTRIEEVINVMGAKFPIYLLVTKCDLIFGMNRFCELLSEPSRDQAMGLMNHDGETDINAFIDSVVDTLVDKLKDIRLILADKEEVRDRHYIEPEVLAFPDEFARLRNGLISFCKGAFKDNPFQERPVVRGIYFCSGRQEGRPVISGNGDLAHLAADELPGTGNGFFLFDFFTKILPADRSLYAMTHRAREWRRLTQNLWLTGFVTLVLIACFLLTHSWNENRSAMNLISPQFKQTVLFMNDPVSDIGIMANFGREIKILEERNQNWRFPRMGLRASINLEHELKSRYCQRFYEHFDADIHGKIESHIADGGWRRNQDAPAIRFIPFITRRINLINARFTGADGPQLAALPAPDHGVIFWADQKSGEMKQAGQMYQQAYIDYLIWQKDVEALNKSMSGMQRLLRNYFHENQGDLRWLVRWVAQQPGQKAVTLNAFWRSNGDDSAMASVAPAFTRQGRGMIGGFVVDELEKAAEDPLWIAAPKAQFEPWYTDAYCTGWMTFCRSFGQGASLFKKQKDWEVVLERLTKDDSPYNMLFETLEKELFSKDDKKWPGLNLEEDKYGGFRLWTAQIKNFGIIRRAAASDDLGDNKAVERLAQRASSRTRLAANVAAAAMAQSDMARTTADYKQYREALEGFKGVTASLQHAYDIARQGFEDDPAQAKSPLFATRKAAENICANISKEAPAIAQSDEDPFGGLLRQPVDHLWKYAVSQAGCHMQKLWDEEVLVEIQGVNSRPRLVEILFGQSGYVGRYTQTRARPFLERSSRHGYRPRELNGCKIPFKSTYFNFVSSGKKWALESGGAPAQSDYTVDVQAFPTDVNIDAKVKPHMTRLVVQNSQGDIVLTNRQYPITQSFNWSPTTCGDVTLEIMIGDITLTRKYTGYCAFGKFLKEFRNGNKTFTGLDFPEYAPEFYRMGVREIEVLYRFQAGQVSPIVKMLTAAPGRPPTHIISCAQ